MSIAPALDLDEQEREQLIFFKKCKIKDEISFPLQNEVHFFSFLEKKILHIFCG